MTESDFTLTGYVQSIRPLHRHGPDKPCRGHASPERFSEAGLYNVVARLIRPTTDRGGEARFRPR